LEVKQKWDWRNIDDTGSESWKGRKKRR
jgi:hypothetical protein